MSRSQRPKHATRARRNAISQFLSPRKRTRPGLIAAIAAITTALLAATIAVVGVVGPASAHNGGVTGTAVCEADGTYTVTWTYTQTNTPDDNEADVTVSAHAPEPSLINGIDGKVMINATVANKNTNGQTDIPTKEGNWSTAFAQTGISGSAKQATVSVHTVWPAWGSADSGGSVTLKDDCSAKDASASVHVTLASCAAAAALVLDTHVNSTFGTPTYPTATTYSVTVTATAGHTFIDGTTTKTFTGTLPARITGDDCLIPVTVTGVVSATPPNCEIAGSLVVPSQTGVVFTGAVNGAGPGTYTVVASAAPGYTLTAPYSATVQVKDVVTGDDCLQLPTHPLVTPALSTKQPTCDAGGSYTLDDIVVDGVRAVVWTVDGKSVAPGTYQAPAGKAVQVHAAPAGPDFGFDFETQTDWTLEFASAENCDQLATLAFTGANGQLGGLMLAGLLLLLAGAGVFTAGRYRARAK
jgi:hypothetical protein